MSDWIRVPDKWSKANKPIFKCPFCGEIYECGYFDPHDMSQCKGCGNVHFFPLIERNRNIVRKIAMSYMKDLDESRRFKQLVAGEVSRRFIKYRLKFTEREIIEDVNSYCAWYILKNGKLEMCEYDKFE